MMLLTTRILAKFTRKVRVPSQKEAALHKYVQQREAMQDSASIDKQSSLQIDKQLEEEFEPLSYDQKIQEALKEKVTKELKYNFQGEDPSPHKLVHRPNKSAVWGLGGQLLLASKKVQLEGLKDDTEDIIDFLELHQVKNIYVYDFHKQNPQRPETNHKRYHIIGSCFSAKHCWKTGLQLKNAFNLNSGKTKLRRKKVYDPIYAIMVGGKSEQWMIVTYKDYEISLMTEQQRQASDLQWKWNNPTSEQVLDRHIRLKLSRKGRRNQFQDLE